MSKSCDDVFDKLIQSGVSPEDVYKAVCNQVKFFFLVLPCPVIKAIQMYFMTTFNYYLSMFIRRSKLFLQLILLRSIGELCNINICASRYLLFPNTHISSIKITILEGQADVHSPL
jgi:hypothetical protein